MKKQKKINKEGYVLIKIENKWVREHIFIAEKHLKRKLKKERVHHIDFNKQNNNPNNLAIFPNTSSHSHFHRQIKQFGMTQPRRTEIEKLRLKWK